MRATLFILLIVVFSCHQKGAKPNSMIQVKITLGEAKFDTTTDSFEYTLFLYNDSSSLGLSDFDSSEMSEANDMAVEIKNWLEQHLEESKEFACSKLLELKNNNWLGEKESPVTKDEFLKRLKLDGINAFKEGGFEIYFMDSDLFGGHWIMVDVNEKFEMERADIVG